MNQRKNCMIKRAVPMRTLSPIKISVIIKMLDLIMDTIIQIIPKVKVKDLTQICLISFEIISLGEWEDFKIYLETFLVEEVNKREE
jgi:hypothetical protein